jgi:biopolymer transport protein ExbD
MIRRNRLAIDTCFSPRRIVIACLAALASATFLLLAGAAHGDDFSRIAGSSLVDLMARADARSHVNLTTAQVEALPEVLPRTRSAFLIVRTDEGNLAKMLVSPGLRKQSLTTKSSPIVPVLVLERFETLEASKYSSFKARGKEVLLFGDFAYDLDSGQVVPQGMGGDIVFKAAGENGPQLSALGETRIYTFDRSVQPPPVARGRPSAGKAVEPTDFTGTYYLIANGQWAGNLEINVKDGGEVSGRFRSDLNGSVYPVSGQVAAEKPQHISFTIQFPRAQQTYDGLLWNEGKNVFAGTLTMLERPYSFVAVREGASLSGPEMELDTSQNAAPIRGRRVVIVLENSPERLIVDGSPRAAAELVEALSQALKADPATEVLLRVPAAVAFERVSGVAETIRKAGVSIIRVVPAGDQ